MTFNAKMKAKAAECACEAQRTKTEFRRMSFIGFALAISAIICAVVLTHTGPRLFCAFTAVAVSWVAISAWRSGTYFYSEWMRLREDALRCAEEAQRWN